MILIFIIVCILILLLLFIVNYLFSPYNPDLEKVSPYECGYAPIHAQTRTPFTVGYYLIALLFLAFDLEIILFFPLGLNIFHLSDYNFWVILLFYTVLTIGFIYELGKGVIEWVNSQN